MIGKIKLTERDKEILRGLVCNICEDCLRPEGKCGKLEVHRITYGYQGGTYAPHNILMLCNECHKMRAEEW